MSDIHADSISAQATDTLDNEASSSPFILTTHIDNTTSKNIIVSLRNGLCFDIPPSNLSIGRGIASSVTITYTLRIRPEVKFDVRHVLNAPAEDLTDELKVLKALIQTAEFEARICANRMRYLEWRFVVSATDLNSQSGVVYLNNLDIQLSTQGVEVTPEHPHSRAAQRKSDIQRAAQLGGAGFIYAVEIIDNDQSVGTRFMNLPGGIFRINSKYDPSRNSGIYFTVLGRHDEVNFVKPVTEFISPKLNPNHPLLLQLFLSKADAEAHGDIVAQKEREYKLEISRLQYDMQQSKLEFARKTADLDYEKRQLDLQKERMDMWQQRLDYEQQQRVDRIKAEREDESYRRKEAVESRKEKLEEKKAIYEERGNNRKDTTEMLKMIPIIIGALLTLKTLLAKK